MILRKTWNIFEYSISQPIQDEQERSKNGCLLCNRHLDQLILCSIYLACKLCAIELQFNDIIRVYRGLFNNSNSSVYRDVLICDTKHTRSDLVQFYNQLFAKQLKSYALLLNKHDKMNKKLVDSNDLLCLSPVPKLQVATSLNTHFTPLKLAFNKSLSIESPDKSNSNSAAQTPSCHTNITIQNFIQPFQQQRNKLKFSFSDANPNKSLEVINEMIKKNEIKIKPQPAAPNHKQRLFTDLSFSNQTNSSVNSLGRQQLGLPVSAPTGNETDETDGVCTEQVTKQPGLLNMQSQNKQQPSKVSNGSLITFKRPSSSFLSTVVGTRLGYMSNNNSNLVTMVIGSGNGLSTASPPSATTPNPSSNFVRKLQNIQSERLN